jgi:NAD+ diphosphatase
MLLPDDFVPLWSQPSGPAAGHWFVLQERKLLVALRDGAPAIPSGGAPVPVDEPRCIGLLGGVPCWAAEWPGGDVPAGFALEPVRGLFDRLADGQVAVAGRAAQVLDFDRTHRFCGACAAPTERADGERARRCTRCEASFYPRLAPAMMVLVTREGAGGRELLLARGTRFSAPMYSALAGFVEPSESLEQCVHREVREEVGIAVKGLRYFRSQSWPFPHSLMVAFLAEHAGGEIVREEAEIGDAGWFPIDRLPTIPHRLSIARQLIDFAVAEGRR